MRTLALAPLALALALGACGGAPPPASATAGARTPPPPAALPPLDDHHLARSVVRDVVSQGLGSFLQYVDVADQPVLAAGKFHGFRIAALRDSPFWQGVDLKPGDVVTGVNGFPIEHPEQAQTAFESLDVSSELRVSYERDGQPRELVYAIVDDR
jgi:type II secretory pathway component PulC